MVSVSSREKKELVTVLCHKVYGPHGLADIFAREATLAKKALLPCIIPSLVWAVLTILKIGTTKIITIIFLKM